MGLGGTPHEAGSCTDGVEVGEAAGREVVVVVREEPLGMGVAHDGGHARGAEHRAWDGRPRRRTTASGLLRCSSTSWASSARSGASTSATAAGARRPPGRHDGAGGLVAAPRPVPVGDGPLHPARQGLDHRVGQRLGVGGQRGGVGRVVRAGWRRPPHATMLLHQMRIRALSVFEGVVYHCWCVDPAHPARPTLEVEAVLRPGRRRRRVRAAAAVDRRLHPDGRRRGGGRSVPRRAGRQGPHRRAPRRPPHHLPHLDPVARRLTSRRRSG